MQLYSWMAARTFFSVAMKQVLAHRPRMRQVSPQLQRRMCRHESSPASGFGIDAYHGVCHANWLENVAALTSEGAFLGATALLERMPEVRSYLDAVNAAEVTTSRHPSIVNGSIVSAIEGHFGDYHRNSRTQSSTLFINPLMSLLWTFDLAAVARRNLYLECLVGTETSWDVHVQIGRFRKTVCRRQRETIPH